MRIGEETVTFSRAELSRLLELVYEAGQRDERDRVAAGLAELDPLRLAPMPRGLEARRADRVAEMEACARQLNAELGRPPGFTYRGGPVEWATGAPGSAPRPRTRR